MDDEMRKTINWLNSAEGRRWSRERHKQSRYARKMFSVKDDYEGDPLLPWRDWGKCDTAGRYRRPVREPYYP